MMECKRYIVHGKVQGVFYRGSAKRRAKELGVTGWVKNLADGTVEVFACAEPQRLQRFYAWLQQGPPASQVAHVSCEDAPYHEYDRFEVES